jgi:hypothetical protein
MENAMDLSRPTDLEVLVSRFDELQTVCDRVNQENAELRHQLSDLISRVPQPRDASAADQPAIQDSSDSQISRRKVLGKVLGAAAVTAVGGGVLLDRTKPAAAATGNNVLAGEITTAEARTSVKYDGSTGFSGVVLLGNDSTYDGSGANYPAGVGGWAGAGSTAGSGGVANGVYGYTDNGAGNGVVGYNSNLVAGAGAGVLGLAFSASGIAVQGTNTLGTAVAGSSGSTTSSATAINGVISSTSPGGFSSAVRGQNNGTGGLGIGVWGSQNGSGWGVYATSVSGIGVNASGGSGVGVSASGGTGVSASGTTVGVSVSGPTAVSATASGTAGTAVLATAASTGPAVAITNSGTGAALQVTGRVHFSRSGTAVVAGSSSTPHSQVTVTGVPLTATTSVLATLQTWVSGVGVAAVVTDVPANSFTIHLTALVSVHATVEWLLID